MTDWNPGAERLLGYREAEIVGRDGRVIFTPEDRARGVPEAELRRALEQGRAEDERWHLRKDGTRFWSSGLLMPLREDGVRGFVKIMRDRTAQHRAAERERFLAEAGDVLVGSLDYAATLQNVARLAASRLADYCVIDIVEEGGAISRLAVAHADPGKEPLALGLRRFPPDAAVPEGTPRTIRTGEPQIINGVDEAYLRASTRGEEHLRIHRELGARAFLIAPLRARGRILGAITLASERPVRRFDAEDLALAQELARRAALAIDNARLYREAQEAARRREEFLTIAAHELKTPLTSLLMHAQLGLRQLREGVGPDEPSAARSLERISAQSLKLARLIGNLLDISRFDAGRLRLERAPTDLVALLREAVAGAHAMAAQHTIRLQAPPELAAVVDPLRLEQVLANLLDNAIKYSPGGGPIEVELSGPSGAWVELSVRDRGVGVAPERRARLFERFFQAHPEHYRSGMGLGLYISRQIVELHGGELRAEFPEDGGTRFVVRLPLGAEQPPVRAN